MKVTHQLLLWADSTYSGSGSSYGNITGMSALCFAAGLDAELDAELNAGDSIL